MVTLNNLRSQSSKDLAKFARSEGIPGWHNMRKEQLIQALTRLLKRRGQPSSNLRGSSASPKTAEGSKNTAKKPAPVAKGIASKPMTVTAKANGKPTSARPAGKDLRPAGASPKAALGSKSTAGTIKAASVTIKAAAVTLKAAPATIKAAAVTKSVPAGPKPAIQKPQPVRKPVRAAESAEPVVESRIPSAVAVRMQQESLERERLKNLALTASLNKDKHSVSKDRVVLIVRDSYWLQAYWEVTEQTVRRARTALEKHWRGAVPVLRLFEFTDDDDQLPEKPIRDIEVHGGVDTWFIDTHNPPKSYRVAIGYAAPNGRFYMIAKSNKVTTPVPSGHRGAGNWADIAQDCENFFALSGGYTADNDARELQEVFEEKLRRPMAPLNPSTAIVIDPRREFQFEVDAQMVVYGVAAPGSSVTLAGEPLKIDPDGTFSVRMDLPDKRQVLPVVASSRDGAHQRTTVLSIERNTKVMEPVNMDIDEP